MKNGKVPTPDDFKFHCEVEVRFRDLDAMGHVNNAVYFSYFEVARTGYMRALGHRPPDEISFADLYPFIILDLYCKYLAPAKLSQKLNVYLRTSRLGTKSYEFEYLITDQDDGRPIAVGNSTQVYYDYRQEQTLPIPEDFRSRIENLEGKKLSV
jgi:acyl-CoA thioester hydrolase